MKSAGERYSGLIPEWPGTCEGVCDGGVRDEFESP